MAKFLAIATATFTRRYCQKKDGKFHLRESKTNPDCLFLKNNKCGIYEARPTQCRTWPFWPEVMNAKAWKRDVIDFCPGAGKGRTFTAQEIRALVAEQKSSEAEL